MYDQIPQIKATVHETVAKLIPFQAEPRKSDISQDDYLRCQAAKKLGISLSTLYRWDSQLLPILEDYKLDRLGSRLPLTDYQVWVLGKLKELYRPEGTHRSKPKPAVLRQVRLNKHLYRFEVYRHENQRIS